jgi:DNA-binding GntR family transcriptional regulator
VTHRRGATPAYLELAGMLRAQIASGRYGPGQRLPSETQLMLHHKVSRSVAKWAISVLKADGLAEGRRGSGVFVKVAHRVVREAHRQKPPDSFAERILRHPAEAGRFDPQVLRSDVIPADPRIADRLSIPPGVEVRCTTSLYPAEDGPLQLMTSWQPAHLLDGSNGPGSRATRSRERVIYRPATPNEIEALELADRGSVVLITRVLLAGAVPVETADIVMPSDRCELLYDLSL